MPSLIPAPVGSTGARYRPIAQVGRGGMAEVLLSTMDAGCGTQRLVVLKRIWPELATDPEFMSMFMDEARLSVRLDHPNLVRTFEVVSDEAGVAMAMEYLDGQPLTRVMNRLRGSAVLSVPLRLRIVMNVLTGLDHAHNLTGLDGRSMGVVHRDVSPQNVFVTYDGQVKLVDFGVAKTLAASHHTRPGVLKGKLAYMAPEQLQAVAVDRRADLFSVGVILWEMLSQKRMWHGMNEMQIVTHLSMGLPFPTLPADAGLPPELDAICARALAADPERRYQTAAEMEMDLARLAIGAADSHARDLGNVVAQAFAGERAARQALIESGAHLPSTERELPVVEMEAGDPDSSPSMDVTISHPGVDTAVVRPAPSRASAAWTWSRRAAGAAVMAAAVVSLLRGEGVRLRPAAVERPAPAAQIASSAPTVQNVAPPLAPAARAARAGGAGYGDRFAGREGSRARRHHSRLPPDEDATLPPTLDLDGTTAADLSGGGDVSNK